MRRREVPSGDVTMILSLGPAIDVDGRPRTSFLASLHEAPALTAYRGPQHGIEVNLTPLGARRLLGMPMHELTNEVVDLDALWGRAGAELCERVHGTEGWAGQLGLVDDFLAERLPRQGHAGQRRCRRLIISSKTAGRRQRRLRP